MKKKRMLCILLTFCLVLFCGCEKEREVPALLDCALITESFRPVDKGSVVQSKILLGNVMPKEYCCFCKDATEIEEVLVDIGDYVKKGDVLVRLNDRELKEKKERLEAELAHMEEVHAINVKINEEKVKQAELDYDDQRLLDDKKRMQKESVKLEELKEDVAYEDMYYEHQRADKEAEIKEVKAALQNAYLTAQHDGYVTYVKNFSSDNVADACENIVIVSDFEELHVELTVDLHDEDFTKMMNQGIEEIYLYVQGKKTPVSLHTFSNEELTVMEQTKKYVSVWLDAKTEGLALGDKIPVYFSRIGSGDVLRVATDSLNYDGSQYFVYVKSGEGKEKRIVQLGRRGEFYAEVLEGLSLGEEVFYSQTEIIPTDYEEYPVESCAYSPKNENFSTRAQKTYTKARAYKTDLDAVVEKVYVKADEEVKRGDLLCVLSVREGGARLTEIENEKEIRARNAVERRKKEAESLEKAEKTIEDYKKATEKIYVPQEEWYRQTCLNKNNLARLESARDVLLLEQEKAEIEYAYDCMKLNKEYEKSRKVNNGSNRIYIYAEKAGVVGSVGVYEGKEVSKEEGFLFRIYDKDSAKSAFRVKNEYINVGNTAQIELADGTVIEAMVVGNESVSNRCYLSYESGKAYITSCISDGDNYGMTYLQKDALPEDVAYSQTKLNYNTVQFSHAIVVPYSAVGVESKSYASKDKIYYVWKVVNGTPVKHYISVQPELNTTTQVCVLEGVSEGDILTRDRRE